MLHTSLRRTFDSFRFSENEARLLAHRFEQLPNSEQLSQSFESQKDVERGFGNRVDRIQQSANSDETILRDQLKRLSNFKNNPSDPIARREMNELAGKVNGVVDKYSDADVLRTLMNPRAERELPKIDRIFQEKSLQEFIHPEGDEFIERFRMWSTRMRSLYIHGMNQTAQKRGINIRFEQITVPAGPKLRAFRVNESVGKDDQQGAIDSDRSSDPRESGGTSPDTLRETLLNRRAADLPVDTVLSESSGLAFRKTGNNEWTTQGLDSPAVVMSDQNMDTRARQFPLNFGNDEDFKERIKDMSPMAQGILTFLRDIVRTLQGFKLKGTPARTPADVQRQQREVGTARSEVEKQLSGSVNPTERQSLIRQRNALAIHERTLIAGSRETANQSKELASNIKKFAAEQGLSSIETSTTVDGIRIRGDASEVSQVVNRISGRGGENMITFEGSDDSQIRVREVRIPLSEQSLQLLTPGRGQQVMEGQRVDRREVSKPNWERVFPFKEISKGGAGDDWIQVSFPPQLAEQALGLAPNSIRDSGFMIQNVSGLDSFAPGGVRNLQAVPQQERPMVAKKAAADKVLANKLGIRVEQTSLGTKIIVPGKLRGKGIKIGGYDVGDERMASSSGSRGSSMDPRMPAGPTLDRRMPMPGRNEMRNGSGSFTDRTRGSLFDTNSKGRPTAEKKSSAADSEREDFRYREVDYLEKKAVYEAAKKSNDPFVLYTARHEYLQPLYSWADVNTKIVAAENTLANKQIEQALYKEWTLLDKQEKDEQEKLLLPVRSAMQNSEETFKQYAAVPTEQTGRLEGPAREQRFVPDDIETPRLEAQAAVKSALTIERAAWKEKMGAKDHPYVKDIYERRLHTFQKWLPSNAEKPAAPNLVEKPEPVQLSNPKVVKSAEAFKEADRGTVIIGFADGKVEEARAIATARGLTVLKENVSRSSLLCKMSKPYDKKEIEATIKVMDESRSIITSFEPNRRL